MTFFDHLKANSTLTVGTAFEHAQNPSGDGGIGGGIVINSNVIDLVEEAPTKIEELSDILTITEEIIAVEVVSTADNIHIIEGDTDAIY